MRVLADLGADPLLPNADNSTPLIVAAGLGTRSPGEDAGSETEVLEAVRLALELGNDINAAAAAYLVEHKVAEAVIASLLGHERRSFADEAAWQAHLDSFGLGAGCRRRRRCRRRTRRRC